MRKNHERGSISPRNPNDITNDPASFGNSQYPINEPAESRHGGSQRVEASGRHK